MTLKFENPRNPEKIIGKLNSQIQKMRTVGEILAQVLPIVEKWQGKKYNKRFESELESTGGRRLSVWKNGISERIEISFYDGTTLKYDDRIILELVDMRGDKIVDFEYFGNQNRYYMNWKKTIEKCEKTKTLIPDYCQEFNRLLGEIQTISALAHAELAVVGYDFDIK